MNKLLIILIILICVIGVMIYKKYHVITYDAQEEYKITVSSSRGCSYIIWFNITTWTNGKKILFKKTDASNKDEFIVFIGDLTNDLFIYSRENKDNPMIPYNNCSGTNTLGNLTDATTFADCKNSCIGNTACVGFTLTDKMANSDETLINKCYISENTEDIFKSSNCLFSELKLIKINHIPLKTVVKLAITMENNNMNVYVNDKIIKSFFLETSITSGTITVTPDKFGFDGFTYFKYFDECLNHEKIKKYSIKL